MLKEKIAGKVEKAVKYHGKVKFIVFACNFCGKTFEKKESYYRKQLKRRSSACLFCSPRCRSSFFFKITSPKSEKVMQGEVMKPVDFAGQKTAKEDKSGVTYDKDKPLEISRIEITEKENLKLSETQEKAAKEIVGEKRDNGETEEETDKWERSLSGFLRKVFKS